MSEPVERVAPRPAGLDDLEQVIDALTASFIDDPMMAWAYPDPAVRPRRLDTLWRHLAEGVYLPGGASTVVGTRATALWRAPGDDREDEFWQTHLDGFIAAMEGDLDRLGAISEQFAAHHPDDDHWYLLAIGVQPSAQGRGLGNALLAHTLAEVDRRGDIAYLEATSARSLSLYERHGFEVLAEVTVDDSPPIWPMWRPEGAATS